MTEPAAPPPPPLGTVGWMDLTVEAAPRMRDFYAAVAGWTPQGISMGDYEDWAMVAPGGQAVGGVCHARGPNTGIPPMWLPYITVADLDASLAACRERGGEQIGTTRTAGPAARFAVVRDPAGACVALYEQRAEGA